MFIPTGPPDAVWDLFYCQDCKFFTIGTPICEKCGKPIGKVGVAKGYGMSEEAKEREAQRQRAGSTNDDTRK